MACVCVGSMSTTAFWWKKRGRGTGFGVGELGRCWARVCVKAKCSGGGGGRPLAWGPYSERMLQVIALPITLFVYLPNPRTAQLS